MSGKPVSDEALTQIFRSMKQEFVTEAKIDDVVTEHVQGVNFVKRRASYAVGDLIHHSSLKKGLMLKCIQAGTTAATDPIT